MRKHFLLLLWLTLLPLAGWAQTAVWNGGSAPDLTYGDAKPNFPTLIAVTSGYGNHNVTNDGEGTSSPTGSVNQYHWKLSKNGSNIDYSSVSTLDAGEYTLTLYIRHRTSYYYYGNATSTLDFTVKKADVTISLYQVVREWKAPWEDPDPATLETSAYTVTGADATWEKIKDALSWNQLQLVEHVGSYKYTIDVDNTKDAVKNYNVHVDASGADLKIDQNTTGKLSDATGKGLTYLATDQSLVPTADITFKDEQGNVAGTIEYKLSTETEWSTEYPTAKDAGTYTVQYKGVGDQDHTDAAEKSYSVTIAKATITNIADWATYFTPAAAVEDELIYNGSAQALITPAVILDNEVFADATIQYRVGTGGWGATNYTATSAQNENPYSVQYRIIDAKNFENFTSAAIQKVIKRVDPTVTLPTPRDVTYNPGSNYRLFNYPDASVGTDFGTLQFRGGTYMTGWQNNFGYIAATNAGKYTVEWRVQQTANVNAADGTIECEIKKANPALNAASGALATLVFNGSDQSLLETNYTVTGGTIQYYVDGELKGAAANVVAKHAGEYTISYKITGNNNYNDYPAEADADPVEIGKATIGQYVLYLGGNTLEGTIEDFYDLDNMKAKISIADFVKDGAFIGGEDDDEKAEIKNALVLCDQTIDEIIAAAKVGNNTVAFKKGSVEPAKTAVTNYAVDGDHLLSNGGTLKIKAKEAAIQAAPIGKDDLVYNGDPQELVATAAVGYKANDGTGSYAIGKVVYSLTEAGEYTEDLTKIVETNAKDSYKVYYKVKFSEEPTSFDRFYEYTVDPVAYIEVKIDQKDLDDKMFTLKDAQEDYTDRTAVYDGSDLTPEVIAFDAAPSDAEKNAIDAETDFDVAKSSTLLSSVTEMVNVDKYTFTFTAKAGGNYKGSAKAEFEITPKELKDEMFYLSSSTEVYNRKDQTPDVYTVATEPIGPADYTFTTDPAGDMIDVDTYTFTFTGQGNYKGTAEAKFEITPAPVAKKDINTPKPIYLTFNGTDQTLVEDATYADGWDRGDFTYAVVAKGADEPADDAYGAIDVLPTGFNAGVYTVYTKFSPDKNHQAFDDIDPVDVTIEKAEISYVLGNISKVWDGDPFDEAQINSLFAINNGELFGVDKYEVPFVFVLPEEYKDAGEYSFTKAEYKFKTIADGYDKDYPENYDVKFTGEANIVIEQKQITLADITAPEAITGLGYTGAAQALVTAGEVLTTYLWDGDEEAKPIGTIMFSNEEDGEFVEYYADEANEVLADAVQGTNASPYTVYFKVVGDKNHKDYFDATPIPGVAIGAKALDDDFFTLAWTEKTYNGQPQSPGITAEDDLENELTEGADKDYTIKVTDGEGAEIAIEDVKDADTYKITFTAVEDGNYSGTAEQSFTIKPIEMIAEAQDAEKVYNGLPGLELPEGKAVEVEVKFGGLLPEDGDAITIGADAITIKDADKNVGEYEIVVDPSKFESTNYKVTDATNAKFTIKPATLAISWNSEYEIPEGDFTKVYGAAEPTLTATADNVKIEGAGEGDADAIINNTKITRAEGEEVGSYAITLSYDDEADVFANYKPITATGAEGIFTITPASIKVSIAAQEVIYNGAAVTSIEWDAEDLVVTGLQNKDDKTKVFEELPTLTIAANEGNVGEYQITLAGGTSPNYTIAAEDYLPSYLTINPFDLSEATVDIPTQQAKVGDVAEDVIDPTLFTISGLVKDKDAAGFKVAVAKDFIDGTGKIIEGADFSKGLVLVADDENDIALNYTGWESGEFTGNLIVEGGSAIVLDDSAPVKLEESAGTVTVTFASRNINPDTWNVIVLPFDVTPAQVSDAFGYAVVDILNENPKDRVDDNAHFSVVTSGTILAGTPFLFKPTKDEDAAPKSNFDEVVFTDVKVEDYDTYILNTTVTDDKGNQFIGTFEEVSITGQNYWYMSGGKWYDARSYKVNIKPLRAYVQLANPAARIMIEEPDGTVTAINPINLNKADAEGMYNLNGVKVNNVNRKGVYIKNGVKVIK